MENRQIIAGITHGDINGIGYEVIIKSLLDNAIFELFTPVVYGSPKVAAYHRKALNIDNFSFNTIRHAGEVHPRRANMINCLGDDVRVELGQPTRHSGEAAFIVLEKAVNDLRDRKIDVLVTAPIDKSVIQSEKFTFPGHTEYLKSKFGADDTLMFMISESMKVGVVTGHIPLAKVAETITTELILKKIRLMNHSLITDFAIRKPSIAVLGLNPHAGDEGLLGTEEKEIIQPAVKKACDEGMMVFGPFSADGFFGAAHFRKFDAVLAMYHDQGLAPFKATAFGTGVNYTAGLPVVRTSPAHGTAFSLAGKGEASESSFRHAIYLACDIFRNRKLYEEISGNPLTRHDIDIHADHADELPSELNHSDNGL